MDHPPWAFSALMRAGLACRAYPTTAELLACTAESGNGCLVVEWSEVGLAGEEVLSLLAQRRDPRVIVFVSASDSIASAVRAMRAGAYDFIPTSGPEAELVRAVREALAESTRRAHPLMPNSALQQKYALLTPRERQVMAGVVGGLLNKQIAWSLQSAERTVKKHRACMMAKMGVSRVADLVRAADELERAGVALGDPGRPARGVEGAAQARTL